MTNSLRFTLLAHPKTPTELESYDAPEADVIELLTETTNGEKEGVAFIPALFESCPMECRGNEGNNCGGLGPHRLNVNVTHMTAIAADIDKIASRDAFHAHVNRIRVIGYSPYWWETYSSEPGDYRGRIVVFFDKPLPLAGRNWKSDWARLLTHLGLLEDADRNASDPARLYYLPRQAPGGRKRETGYSLGRPLSWESILPPPGEAPPRVATPAQPTTWPPASEYVLAQARADVAKIVSHPGGGDHAGFRVMSTLFNDYQLSEAEALPLAREWNARQVNPRTEEELQKLRTNGERHAQGNRGEKRRTAEMAQKLNFVPKPRKATARVGRTENTASNVALVLEEMELDLYYDDFHGKLLTASGEWSDADLSSLHMRIQLETEMRTVPLEIVKQGVNAYAFGRRRNSVREEFLAYKWDRTPRIAELFVRGFGAEQNEYTEAVGRYFVCGIAKRVLEPGAQVDKMPVLEGPQGIFKSTGCRLLAGAQYFGEVTKSPKDKDFYMELQGRLICEWGELESFKRSEVDAIKHAVSSQVDRYRAPYASYVADHPRQGVFIGTTNDAEYLRDQTGNRRFLPIVCGTIDKEWIAANREQLFAEAVVEVRANQDWWDVPEELARAEQEKRRHVDPWEDALRRHFETNPDLSQVKSMDVLEKVLSIEPKIQNMTTYKRLSAAMRKLGWKMSHTRKGNSWVKGCEP